MKYLLPLSLACAPEPALGLLPETTPAKRRLPQVPVPLLRVLHRQSQTDNLHAKPYSAFTDSASPALCCDLLDVQRRTCGFESIEMVDLPICKGLRSLQQPKYCRSRLFQRLL